MKHFFLFFFHRFFLLYKSLPAFFFQNPSCGPTKHPGASSLSAPQQSQNRSSPDLPTTSSSQFSLPCPSLQKPMALETSPPVKRARWRLQAVGASGAEGSKRRLQWRQVRQVGEAKVEVEEELAEVVADGASSSSIARDGGQMPRHRLCLHRGREENKVEPLVAANCALEPAASPGIAEQKQKRESKTC